MMRNDDYFEIIKEQNKELAKFRPFKSAYEMKEEIKRLNNIINEVRELLTKDYEITINNFVADNPRYLLDKFEEILDKENR